MEKENGGVIKYKLPILGKMLRKRDNDGITQFGKPSYSQYGEDILIEHLFPSVRSGCYLDLGSFDPFLFSNTAKLYENGWRGVNVDANPKSIKEFNKFRPEDKNLNFAIGLNESSKLNVYVFRDKTQTPCNTVNYDNAKRLANIWGIDVPEPIAVPVVRLETLMTKYFSGQMVHILNIDLETMDLDCLKS